MKQIIQVGLEERSYPIIIQAGLLQKIGPDLAKRNIAKRYGIIADDNVAALYGDSLLASLSDAGLAYELITFPHGEESKNVQTVATLASQLVELGFDRADCLIALGGGVSGDICGFLASVYMRGVSFIQIPTTLLAQVDSSVGGKTGVDIPEGKNLIGTFYQPKCVYIDTVVLKSLPRQELVNGLAEVIKYGVIYDASFFDFLTEKREQIVELDTCAITEIIARSCSIKAQVVEQDEREGGLRRILNFGHTIGHAVEATSNFSIAHGAAVGIGMAAAADLAVRGGHLQAGEAETIKKLIGSYAIPIEVPADLDRGRIKKYLLSDKKTIGGKIFFVLPTKIGTVIITDKVARSDIDAVLNNG